MTRFLLTTLILLSLASLAAASHRSLLGWREGVRTRVVTRDRHVERTRERGHVLERFRGGSGCVGVTAGGGCIGTVTAVRVPVRTGAGCTGLIGPSLPPPVVRTVPVPMPPRKP